MSCARATISACAATGRQNTKWKRDSAATATIMLCRTLRCGKRLVTWKVRASPSAARRWTGKRVALVPRIQISPELGAICPLMTLKSVVFPAPFVPMTARLSPAWSCSDTPSSARTPPKLCERLLTTSGLKRHSSCDASTRPKKCQRALRCVERDDEIHDADHEQPAFGVGAHHVLQQHEHNGPEHGAKERACCADQHHDEHLSRNRYAQRRRTHEAVEVDEEFAGDAGKERRNDRGEILILPDGVSERSHPRLVFPHALERITDGRAHEHPECDRRYDEHEKRQVEKSAGGCEERGEPGQSWPFETRQAIVTAGQLRPAHGQAPEQLRERQRDHQVVATCGSQREQIEKRGRNDRYRDARRRRERKGNM